MTFDKILSDLGFDEGTENNMILLLGMLESLTNVVTSLNQNKNTGSMSSNNNDVTSFKHFTSNGDHKQLFEGSIAQSAIKAYEIIKLTDNYNVEFG